VKIYVTGFVRAPGLYGGMSADSVLNFLDKAGGIDPDRGSYLRVQVQRGGKVRAVVDLYKFLLSGQLESLQLQDGDTIVVQPRQYAVTVTGEAQNPYVFELSGPRIKVADLMTLALPKARATHLSIGRNTGVELKSEYYPLSKASQVEVQSGDVVNFTADKYATTILVRIEGAQMGERSFVMANGAKLRDLISRLSPSPNASMESMQLFRKSVATRQKKSLELALRNLETAALTARSSTSEEAALRKAEADMMLNYINRASQIQPLGQVVLSDRQQAQEINLEDGDVVLIPEKRNLVLLTGEVLFPNAQVYTPRASAEDYIAMAGGYSQKADTSRLVIVRLDGSVVSDGSKPGPGDEIMVLPKIDSKNVEIARGLSQIIYQIAVSAKVVFGL
jgi:protein involved in polysaccharide export with SLBB domain